MMLNALLASTVLASSAVAHFHLLYPAGRGFIENKASEFCGGFPDVGARQPFPLGKGPVSIYASHPKGVVNVFVATKVPASNADFNTTANGTVIPEVTKDHDVANGNSCWDIDLESLNLGLTNGSEVTIAIQYDGGDGDLYQCTDLVLLSNYTVPQNATCAATTNATDGHSHGTNTSTTPTSTASGTPSPTKSNGASLTKAALGVGALAALAGSIALL